MRLILSLIFFLISFHAAADDLVITPQNLTFRYQTFDGERSLNCTHTLQNALSQDWSVVCGDKHYTVHLWITKYTSELAPKARFEILYWVTELDGSQKRLASAGATTWVNLKDDTSLDSLTSSQSVENDTAGLYLEFKVN